MGLNYPGKWKFEGFDCGLSQPAVNEFIDLIIKIANGSKEVIEDFKAAFGGLDLSTSYDWAITDLSKVICARSTNAAIFLDNLWSGIEKATSRGLPVPTHTVINKLLAKYGIPLEISPPDLLRTQGDSVITDVASATNENIASVPVPTFVLGARIGAGGYGVVYKATKTTAVSAFEYALKILDPSPFVEDYDKALGRFRREVQALQSLQHRSIVQYFEAGLTIDNKPYVVMPFIKGNDLRSAARAMNLPTIVSIFVEILLALEYAHAHNVLHRDLKPSNIIVRSSDQQPIILDFGSAYILDQLESQTLTTQAIGTVGYIPSEVLADPKRRSPLHDIYACGIMLYESLAGRLPDPANYSTLGTIDQEYKVFDSVIKRAIAGEASRTRSAGDFANQLQSLRIPELPHD